MKLLIFLSLFFCYLLTVNSKKSNCWNSIKELGYECCEEGCTVVFADKDGDWGIENDQWCGCSGIEFEEYYNKSVLELDCPDEIKRSSKCWKDCEIEWDKVISFPNSYHLYYSPSSQEAYGLRFSCYPKYYEYLNNKN